MQHFPHIKHNSDFRLAVNFFFITSDIIESEKAKGKKKLALGSSFCPLPDFSVERTLRPIGASSCARNALLRAALLRAERGLRRRQPRNRHAEWRATDIAQSHVMTKHDR